MKTRVIAGFPAIGKSYLFNNSNKKILDSDSSKFDKLYFPNNYISHIKMNIDKVDIILVSTHKIVRDALKHNNIKYELYYPDISLKDVYCKRIENRNQKMLADIVRINWDNWIKELEDEVWPSKYVLKNKDEYLSDYIK